MKSQLEGKHSWTITMEVERLTTNPQDCELDEILHESHNDPSGWGLKAVKFLNKMAYFDQSDGVNAELCYLIISCTTVDSDPHSTIEEEEAKKVLMILQDHKLIHEKQKKNPNSCKSFQMLPSLHEKLSKQNQQNASFIIELAATFKNILMYVNAGYLCMSHVFHIHKSLRDLNWPQESIKYSVYFAVQLLIYRSEMEMGLKIVDDVTEVLKSVSFTKCVNVNETDWFAIQMIRIYNDTIMKSRKILQPSDAICVDSIDGVTQHIQLNSYGSWILDQIRICSDSQLDCDALILVGEATLDRLQKHERFCNKPNEQILNWVISYDGREWHSLNCFAALACFSSSDGRLEELCQAYVRKLAEKMCGNSEYSFRNAYLSWVCLRDLVKTSRIRDQMISALTDDEGLHFLFMNFKKCESTLESKEYFLKYQGQTVVEMLTPLLIHAKLEDVEKLFKSQEFWNFVNLVLIKHPFINERYNSNFENDLLCACEVYLDLLIAICNRNHAIPEGFLKSFLSQHFLQTFTIVIQGARELSEPRQRHTCEFYLFTILFTLFNYLKDVEMTDLYFNTEIIHKEIEEFSQDNFIFQVQDGCLREYRMHLTSFIEFYKNETETRNSNLTSIAQLVFNMVAVPRNYDWESDEDENPQ